MAEPRNKELFGALFHNDRARTSKSPGYTGRITIGGKEYKLAGWMNRSINGGQQYMTLKATPWDKRDDEESQPPPEDF